MGHYGMWRQTKIIGNISVGLTVGDSNYDLFLAFREKAIISLVVFGHRIPNDLCQLPHHLHTIVIDVQHSVKRGKHIGIDIPVWNCDQ